MPKKKKEDIDEIKLLEDTPWYIKAIISAGLILLVKGLEYLTEED